MIHSLKIFNALGGEYKAKQNRCCELGVLPSYIVGAFENTIIIQVLMILKVRKDLGPFQTSCYCRAELN